MLRKTVALLGSALLLAVLTAAPAAADVPPAQWYLRNVNWNGNADLVVPYGIAGYRFVDGDWAADGRDSVGVFTDGSWFLRRSNNPGPADISFAYGSPGDVPVVGDWDGNGTDTIGVYENGWWYLRNSNTPGAPDIVVNYGGPGYTPVVGDWNGDGVDTIGVFVNGSWYLRNTNRGGAPDLAFAFGTPGADYTVAPVVGDWTGSGRDGIGVVTWYVGPRPMAGNTLLWYLRNTATPGPLDPPGSLGIRYGLPSYAPVTGDWDGNGTDTIGVVVS